MSFEKPPRPIMIASTFESWEKLVQWEKDRADRAEYSLDNLIADCKRQSHKIFELCADAQRNSQ